MTYQIAKAAYEALIGEASRCSAALQAFPKVGMGLTPDAVKFSPDYCEAVRAYYAADARLRGFAVRYLRTYKAEIQADRRRVA